MLDGDGGVARLAWRASVAGLRFGRSAAENVMRARLWMRGLLAGGGLATTTVLATFPADGQVRFRPPPIIENVERFGLVNAPGVQETIQVCGNCHAVVVQDRDDAFWDNAWVRMLGMGMADQPPERRDVILNYLKTNHSTER